MFFCLWPLFYCSIYVNGIKVLVPFLWNREKVENYRELLRVSHTNHSEWSGVAELVCCSKNNPMLQDSCFFLRKKLAMEP